MNICDTNLFGNGLLYVTFNQDQGILYVVFSFFLSRIIRESLSSAKYFYFFIFIA